MGGGEKMTETPRLKADLTDAIDRYGSALQRWPDPALANEVRAAVLADRGLRHYLDGAVTLDRRLGGMREALDAEIVASGAVVRIGAALQASLPDRHSRSRWIAVAAALVFAAGLGSVFDLRFLAPLDERGVDVVVLDPLVFGPTEVEIR
jgi:hypothetical protein